MPLGIDALKSGGDKSDEEVVLEDEFSEPLPQLTGASGDLIKDTEASKQDFSN